LLSTDRFRNASAALILCEFEPSEVAPTKWGTQPALAIAVLLAGIADNLYIVPIASSL